MTPAPEETALTQPQRDALLRKAWELDGLLYPPDRTQAPSGLAATRLRERYYRVLGEYADRLPRVLFSLCPLTGAEYKHSFDPWGLDGPWWHQDRDVAIEEPAAPPTFKVLLGALALRGRPPRESREPTLPGPEVPFVVPRLLQLPGMVAVLSRLDLETGDTAYPIAYFSAEPIPQNRLHQFWLQQEHWFETDEGKSAWMIANDVWDFDLGPWVDAGKLCWLETVGGTPVVKRGGPGSPCPFLDLPGDRFPQSIAFGERELLALPDGTPIDPFED